MEWKGRGREGREEGIGGDEMRGEGNKMEGIGGEDEMEGSGVA